MGRDAKWRAGIVGVLALAIAGPAWAENRPPPPGLAVVLTVSGAIAGADADGVVQFSLADLAALGEVEFSTSTIWTEGVVTFTGVPLSRVLDHVGATGGTLVLTALNDYSASKPASEVEPEAPLIAYLRDGVAMPVRDKGPLWVVYPYDASPAYQSEIVFSRSVWQLARIHVTD